MSCFILYKQLDEVMVNRGHHVPQTYRHNYVDKF